MIASVIIPVHEREELTRRCLYTWLRQAHVRGGYELVVVDDASTTFDVAKCVEECRRDAGRCPRVQYIRLESDYILRSPNTAYRAGIAAARSDRLLVLSSQDVLVPRYALLGLADTVERFPERRASMTVHWLSEGMQAQIETYPWREDLSALREIVGFWTQTTLYGRPNATVNSGALFVLASAMTREHYEWMGGLRDALLFGSDDRDLVAREAVLHRGAKTVPDLACLHQYHSKPMHVRAHMSHPGYLYKNEAQARLLEPAEPVGPVPDMSPFKKSVWKQKEPREDIAPEWAVLLFQSVLAKVRQMGVQRVALSGDWFGAHMRSLTCQAGFELLEVGEPRVECVISVMEMQCFHTLRATWAHRDRLRQPGVKLVALTTYQEHFHSGPNVLALDEESLGAPEVDTSMTGYMLSTWQ